MEGVENDDVAAVDRMLQYDSVGSKNFNVSLLHKAVQNSNYKICKMLVNFGAGVNMLNLDDQNSLNVAENNGKFSICKRLVRKRKEKRVIYKKALHICAKQNYLMNLKKHINSVDVNETDEKMRTPLHVAMIFGSDAMCNLLLKYGADVYAKDRNMVEPKQLASYCGRLELRKRILSNVSYIG